MVDVRYHGKGPEQRIADRLKPSSGPMPTTAHHQITTGTGPTRTVTTIHHHTSQAQHGPTVGGNDISGQPRSDSTKGDHR